MAEDIKFRHTMPVQIRFSDVDQFGHMNNSVYFSLYDLALDAGGDIKLLKEINSKGIKIYYSFQNALENGRDLCKELKKLGKDRICLQTL